MIPNSGFITNAFWLTLLTPLIGALLLAFSKKARWTVAFNCVLSGISFCAAVALAIIFWRTVSFMAVPAFFMHQQFLVDALNIILIVLTTFIGFTTSLFSAEYMLTNFAEKRIRLKHLRLYHSLYQVFIFTMLLALVANNIGILWVALEAATLATVLLVSLYRTPEAIEAAWKYFILCIVGIALALFGTILVYFAAQKHLPANSAILWSELIKSASVCNPTVMGLALVFLFVGYGTKIGLVPMHSWLPDAHSESPGPMSALLSGLLLNTALYALVRFKPILDGALPHHPTATLMIVFGTLSFVFAAIALFRQQNIKRMFSYSSIEHMGLLTCAFGIGGQLATFAALIYMVVHSLVKSAIFTTVGNVIHLTHTQRISKIRALLERCPSVAWVLLLATIAVMGFPPFGLFTSELLLLLAIVKVHFWLAVIIIIGTIIACAALLRNIQLMIFGSSEEAQKISEAMPDKSGQGVGILGRLPAMLHLLLAAMIGVYIPSALIALLNMAVAIVVR